MAFIRLASAGSVRSWALMRNQLNVRMIATEAPRELDSAAAVELLKEKPVMVYAKSYCPYVSRRAAVDQLRKCLLT